MTDVKVVGLTASNVAALREVFPDAIEADELTVTSTTATFRMSDPVKFLENGKAEAPGGRGHPRGSLNAVIRKVRAATEGEQ